jgi:biotin transporter BioY
MRLSFIPKFDAFKRKSIVGQLVVSIIGVQLLFFGSFVALSLPTATQRNLACFMHNQELAVLSVLPYKWQQSALERLPALGAPAQPVRFSLYVPIVPLTIFLGYCLGATLGLLAAATYFILGLLAPFAGIYPFASGGGLDYWSQPGFGYLLGCVAAAWCAGLATAKRPTSFRQSLAIASGLAAAHAVGLIYLFGSCLISLFVEGTPRFPQWRPWVLEEARNLSWYTLPYDLIFSFAAIGLGFPFRWLVDTLTAPDIAAKARNQQRIEDFDLDPV